MNITVLTLVVYTAIHHHQNDQYPPTVPIAPLVYLLRPLPIQQFSNMSFVTQGNGSSLLSTVG